MSTPYKHLDTTPKADCHRYYKINVKCSIIVGYVVFIGIIITLWSIDIVPEAKFFSFSFNNSTPPHLLGIPLTSETQFYGMGVWFFLNAFMTIWSTAVINPIFSSIMITKDDDTHLFGKWLFPIMIFYEILKSVRYFVSLLGVLSNAYWFTMTSSGWLIGALTTRGLYLCNDWTKSIMKHNYVPHDHHELPPVTSINASVLSSLHRRRIQY